LLRLGDELRHARLESGLSQATVAAHVGLSGSSISRIESGRARSLSLVTAGMLAGALGLDLTCKLHPGGRRLRDEGQLRRLRRLLSAVSRPLVARHEVPLPRISESPEWRAWDAMVSGSGLDTAIELEMRLHDAQAQERRLALKFRDGQPDRLLLVIADTDGNRRVLREHAGLFGWLPRLRTARVLADLAAGRHPPTGFILF
jgi:transcriptional regulator with XRE-family HTH domain